MAYAERSRGTRLKAEWARLNMNFGLLLLDRELDKLSDRIEATIARFNNALAVYTPQAFPERWARVMLNLGIAYSGRLTGDRADDIEQAIEAYQNALRLYARTSDPVKWASAPLTLLRRRPHTRRHQRIHANRLFLDALAFGTARRRGGRRRR